VGWVTITCKSFSRVAFTHSSISRISFSDVNKDWTCKDKDKDKDLIHKDQLGQGQGLKFGHESFQSITCTGTDNLRRTTKIQNT